MHENLIDLSLTANATAMRETLLPQDAGKQTFALA